MADAPLEVSVHDLKRALDSGTAPVVVDVREPWEVEICAIAGATLIPLSQFAAKAGTLDPAQPVYIYCHHGGRSMQATQWLRRNGYGKASNVAGGIHAWAEEIDPGMAKY